MKFILILTIVFCSIIFSTCESDNAFIKLGSFRGQKDGDGEWFSKSYFVPRNFRSTWQHIRGICRAYDMDFVAIETLEEFEAVRDMCISNPSLLTEYTHIGGMSSNPNGKTDWFWVATDQPISYRMQWRAQDEPNFHAGRQWCLALGAKSGNTFLYDDIDCFGNYEEKFICQRYDSFDF